MSEEIPRGTWRLIQVVGIILVLALTILLASLLPLPGDLHDMQ